MSDRNSINNLRQQVAKVLIGYLWLHPPVVLFAAWQAESALTLSAVIASVILCTTATISRTMARDGLTHPAMIAVASVGQAALLVLALRGHPWQIDMHMYFFAVLAIMAAFNCQKIIILSAATIAAHHLILNFVIPAFVFPDGGNLWRVILHAVIVIAETGVPYWAIGRTLALHADVGDALLLAQQAAEESERTARHAEEASREARDALERAQEAEAQREHLAKEQKAAEARHRQEQAARMNEIAELFNESVGAIVERVRASAMAFSVNANELSDLSCLGNSRCQDVERATARVKENVAAVQPAQKSLLPPSRKSPVRSRTRARSQNGRHRNPKPARIVCAISQRRPRALVML